MKIWYKILERGHKVIFSIEKYIVKVVNIAWNSFNIIWVSRI